MKIFTIAFALLFTCHEAVSQTGAIVTTLQEKLFEGDSRGEVILFQPNNKILIAGNADFATNLGDRRIGLLKYNSNGTFDNTFGTNGVVRFTVNTDSQTHHRIVEQDIANNCIYIVSSYNKISKLTLNGVLDTTFGISGTIQLEDDTNFVPKKMEIQPNGSFIIYGTSVFGPPGTNSIRIFKYLSTGVLDPTFGTNGKKILSLNNLAINLFVNGKCYLQPNNKYIVSGSSVILDTNGISRYYLFLRKFNFDGTIDTTFGTNGTATSNLIKYESLLEIEPNGNIKVIGNGSTLSIYGGSLVTVNFDANGIYFPQTNVSFTVPLQNLELNSLIKQSDGKYLVAGSYLNVVESNGANIFIARYLTNGNLDPTFAINGIYKDSYSYGNESIYKLAISPKNELYFTGYRFFNLFWEIFSGKVVNNSPLRNESFENLTKTNLSPNPVNGFSTINFAVDENEVVSIDLYNITGALIRKFVSNKLYTKGNHSVDLHFDSVEKGIYFLKISYVANKAKIVKVIVNE